MAIKRICTIEGCNKILKKTNGRICPMHRSRFFRHGNYDISPKWPNIKKGTPQLTKLGYMRININGRRMLEHRYIMEQRLGRKLSRQERIHHKNGNKTDNRIENLELFGNNSKHMKLYHPDVWKNRKTSPEYTNEKIKEIIQRVKMSVRTFNTCFCGRTYFAKNLCDRHYAWAYVNKVFEPKRKEFK